MDGGEWIGVEEVVEVVVEAVGHVIEGTWGVSVILVLFWGFQHHLRLPQLYTHSWL